MKRSATNDVSDIDGAVPRPLRPFAGKILTRHDASHFTANKATGSAGGGDGNQLRCVDPLNPTYPLSWVSAPSDGAQRKAPRPHSACAASRGRSKDVSGGTQSWNTNKLEIADIAGRPKSANLRGRDTGSRSLDYSDVARSTSAQNARRSLNFSKRNESYALRTDDISGARPRSPNADEVASRRDPLSPRYKCDTTSMAGTVVKATAKGVSMTYGGFEKRGQLRRTVARAVEREEAAGRARSPSSLRTDVERPPEHPNSMAAARQRWHRDGLTRQHIDPSLAAADVEYNALVAAGVAPPAQPGPGERRPTFTTFAHEAPNGRNTNPAAPLYAAPMDRKAAAAPQRRRDGPLRGVLRPQSGGSSRAAPAAPTSQPKPAAPSARQREIDMVRARPNW